MLTRYIRIYENGSSANAYNQFVEVQAIDKNGDNVAYGKGLLEYSSNWGGESYVTDGDYSEPLHYFDMDLGLQYIIIDLGSVVDLIAIKLWRYYADSRIYYGTIIQTSIDNENYTDVFNHERDGTYTETSAGKTVYLSIDPVNYTSIDDIVSSIGNASRLRKDTKNDDGTDTVTGVNWFSYCGNVCNSIYANGNSWIGLCASSEHFKFNRRDSAMWNLWREEGTYLGYYKFLRIRWNGYSAYGSTDSNFLQTFDLILFDTGDIMIYAVDIPTANYDGTFYLGNLTYTAPTTENRFVTFYLQSDGTYTVDYAPISLELPYTRKYLIRDNNTIYTVENDVLTAISGELNAQLFIDNGVDDIPSGNLLIGLNNPYVLCWTDSDIVPTLKATVQGTPIGEHDVISDDIRIGHESIFGITSVEATASEGATFSLSFDNGAWMVYDTSSNSWIASDVGMSYTELVAIPTDAWSSVVNSATTMRLKATIDGIETVTQVKFNFDNTSPIDLESEVE